MPGVRSSQGGSRDGLIAALLGPRGKTLDGLSGMKLYSRTRVLPGVGIEAGDKRRLPHGYTRDTCGIGTQAETQKTQAQSRKRALIHCRDRE